MPSISWNPAFSVGSDKLDRQHQKWFDLYNDMRARIGGPRGLAPEALEAMKSYAADHFADEEAHMAGMGYPEFDAHREHHKDFRTALSGYCRQLRAGETGLDTQILDFIKNWLLEHVAKQDLGYARFSGNQD